MTEICSICYDSINETNKATVRCGHIYHTDCLMQHCITSRAGLCPCCRNNIVQNFHINNSEQSNNYNDIISNISQIINGCYKDEKEFEDIYYMNRKKRTHITWDLLING